MSLTIQDIDPEWRQLLSPLLLAEGIDPSWVSTRHHKIIDREFRQLITPGNPYDILIITCPPRFGKSTYLSHWAPAHYLLRRPSHRIMLCSYGMRLAKFLSRRVRDRVHQCAPLFGLKGVNPMVSAADDWELDGDGGGLMASGVEGSIIGRGANLILIDDYIRKGKDAASPTVRENQWEWFQSTVSTRREPGAKICILATPWHSGDLIGRIMAERDELGLKVRRVAFQAIREDDGTPDPLGRQVGESLWPERWPVEVLLKQKRLMGPYWWQAQYQGVPGNWGRNEWPETYFSNIWAQDDEWPDSPVFSAVALDPSKGARDDSGDYQALCYVAFSGGILYLDFDVDRRPVPQLMRDMARFCKDRRPGIVGIESNAFQDLLAPDYLKACADIGYSVTDPILLNNSIQKEVRIMRLASYLDARAIRIRRNAGGEEFIRQAKLFPNGDHDDACFVAGTRIAVPGGHKAIEDIRVGDWVLTRFGPRRVIAAGCTGIRDVVRVDCERGSLSGTADHPILGEGMIWRPMLESCSMVAFNGGGLCQGELATGLSRSFIGGSSFAGTPIRSGGRIAITTNPADSMLLGESRRCIGLSGGTQTAKSHSGTTSTTSTAIHPTTRWKTLSAYRPRIMPRGIPCPMSGWLPSGIIWPSSDQRPPSGTALLKGWSGIEGMAPPLWRVESPRPPSALTAALSSSLRVQQPSSVEVAAGSDSMRLSVLPVVSRSILGRSPVYNLTVEGAHEYIANGFVVHNCDAAEMAIRLLNYYVTGAWSDDAEILVA